MKVTSASWVQWTGYSSGVLELHWLTEPGWIELQFATSSFYAVIEEVGGRCDLRSRPEAGYEGSYFGSDQVTLAAAKSPIVIHAHEMRQATIICCAMSADGALDEGTARVIDRSATRLMIMNRLLFDCARLFGTHVSDDATDIFAAALSNSVLLAWAEAARQRKESRSDLSGETLHAVLTFIRNELDEQIRVGELAAAAGLSPMQFGKHFEAATGLSPQAWQMDARVRNAQRLMLDEPHGSLAEYAKLCGFADQSHLSRVFLKVVGQSPTEWLNRFL